MTMTINATSREEAVSEIIAQYHESEVCVGEMLDTVCLANLTAAEVVQVYAKVMNHIEEDEIYHYKEDEEYPVWIWDYRPERTHQKLLPVDFRKNIGPNELIYIQAEWAERAMIYGDKGSCVLGAGFEFTFNSNRYFMKENSNLQGSLSWENSKFDIQTMLTEAGATDITYHWGRLD